MTLLEEIQGGENAALEFKEARPKDSLKFTKTVVAFANEREVVDHEKSKEPCKGSI